ncbi:sperm acrosome-associated protein 7 [Psammomys obesus]|uniref:sperm acrosome-associated protein 7 n=1 Tax=Psammomys obesus TaxID=48139 RepID=UPI002452CC80|nr:sperm acrosome-associated protein 7 [Psammomys obesus]
MAANRGVETFLSVFLSVLLCSCPGTELKAFNITLGSITDDSLNSTNEDIPEVFDEILAQEILEPNNTAMSEAPQTTVTTVATTVTSKEKCKYTPSAPGAQVVDIDENYQEDGSENYHELLENLEVSSTNKENPENNEEKSPSNDLVLGKILENIGRSSGSLELTGKYSLSIRPPARLR